MDYLSAAVGGDRARRGADIWEREGERMEGGIPIVHDRVLESMVLESVDLLVLGSGRSLLGRERERVFHYQYLGNTCTIQTTILSVLTWREADAGEGVITISVLSNGEPATLIRC